MKKFLLSFFMVVSLSLSFLPGTEVFAADSVITNAVSDLERFEGQANGLSASSNAASAKRILKLVNLSHERLGLAKDQSSAEWLEVNKRFEALKGKLEAITNGSGAPAVPTTVAKAAPAAPAAPVVNINQNTEVQELVSGERVRVKKLTRDMIGVREGIQTTGPSEFQSQTNVSARQQRLKQFSDALTKYPQLNDPDVAAARKEYDALQKALSAEFNRAKSQLTELGNVQERLATLELNSSKYPAPKPLAVPFTQVEAEAWTKASSEARTVAEHNLKELAKIAPLAYLPNNPGTPQNGHPYDAQDVERLTRNAQATLKEVEQNYADMASALKSRLNQIQADLGVRWQDDPASDEKRWTFIGEGKAEEAETFYNEALAIANSSVSLEKSLGRTPTLALETITTIEKAKAQFAENRKIALESSRLPEAKSNDKKMLKIAEEILTNPKYEFGEHGKIVLTTSEIVEREKKSSEIEIDDAEFTLSGDLKMSGTETTWTYKWKEFKFAVPLKETGKDEWYIWWITAKNFSSGGDKTPLNKWISGNSNKGNPILKKNL